MAATTTIANERLARVLNPEPCDLESLRTWLGITQGELAAVLGRSPRTIARWKAARESQPTKASAEIARSVRLLGRAKFLLEDLMPHEAAVAWLQAPNIGFRGEAPIDLLMSGRMEIVIAVLEALADGGTY